MGHKKGATFIFMITKAQIVWRSEVVLCDVILYEFITWALLIPDVARTPSNQQSISGFVDKVHR